MIHTVSKTYAIKSALSFFNSIRKKDFSNFQKCFHPDPHINFVDILPGGKKILSSNELIKIHPAFFNSSYTSFEPINSSEEFSENHFAYTFKRDFLLQVGVDVKVTKPIVLSEEEDEGELETIYNHLSLTLVFDENYQQWFPQMITNTIIDK